MDRVLPAIAGAQESSATLLAILEFCQVSKAGSCVTSTQAPAGIKVLSAAILPHVASAEMSSLGLQALLECAHAARQVSTVMRMEGGVKACIAVLREHCQRAALVSQGLRLLSMVSYSALTCVAIAKEKGFPDLLLTILRTHLTCADIINMAAELVAVITRQEKALRLFSADLLVATAKAVTASNMREWAAIGHLLRAMKNFAKLEDGRKELAKSSGCINYLLGAARILARAPGEGRLLKRASRVAWLLAPHVLVPLPPFDLRWKKPVNAGDESETGAGASSTDDEFHQRLYPEDSAVADYLGRNASSLELPPAVTRARMAHFGSIAAVQENGEPFVTPSAASASRQRPAHAHGASAGPWAPSIGPGGAGGRAGRRSSRGDGGEDKGEPFHCGDESVVAECILADLSRIASPSLLLNEVVYDEMSAPPVMLPTWQTPSPGALLSPGMASKRSPDSSTHSSPEETSRAAAARNPASVRVINVVSPSGGVKGQGKGGSARRQTAQVFSLPSLSLQQPLASGGKVSHAAAGVPLPSPSPEPFRTPPGTAGASRRIKRSQSISLLPASTAPVTNFHHAALECPPLKWESRFESGNLRRVVRVHDREYDLVLREDTNDPMLHFQWFYFAVADAVPGARYRFNIVNMGKKDSLFNEGLRPLMWKQEPQGRAGTGGGTPGDNPSAGGGSASPWPPPLPYMQPPPLGTPSRRSSRDDARADGAQAGRCSPRGGEGEGMTRAAHVAADATSCGPPAHSLASGGWHRVGTDVCYYPSPYRWSSPYRADVTSTKKGKEGPPMVRSRSSFGASAGLAAGIRADAGGPTTAAPGGKGGARAAAAADASIGIGQGLYGLSFCVTFDSSVATYFFAYCVPYTYSDLQEYLSSLAATVPRLPHILCRSALCPSYGGNRVELLTITDFATLGEWRQASQGGAISSGAPDNGRQYVLMSCRVHPGESNSSWVMKGILDFLLGPSPRADWLRRKFIFKMIPMSNPDGVINGCNRSSLAGNDLNRCWQKPDRRRHPCIYYAKRAAECLAEDQRLALFCDCHGHSRKKDVFMYGCEPPAPASPEDAARVRVLPYLLSRRSHHFNFSKCNFKVQKSKQTCARVVVAKELGVRNSYTLECSMAGCESSQSHFTTTDLESLGESLCEALIDAAEVLGGPDEPQLLDQVMGAMTIESQRISVSSNVTSGSLSCPEL